jgi:hypothetical protein
MHYFTTTHWVTLFLLPVVPVKKRHLLLCPVCSRGVAINRAQAQKARHLVAFTASLPMSSDEGKEHYAELVAELTPLLLWREMLDDSPKLHLKPSVPGWYADPSGRNDLRFWDGGWTDQVSSRGVQTTDPVDGTDG